MTEQALQNLTRSCLALLGYTILETGKGRSKQRCKRCGTESYATGWQGNTPGLPDLYIHAPWWRIPFGLGIEMKTATGAVRKEQANLANQGMTRICRTVNQVVDALVEAEVMLGNPEQLDRIESFRRANTTIFTDNP